MTALAVTFAVTLAASLALVPLARRLASATGALDHPDGQRKLQRRPVPLLGGVGVYLAMLVGLWTARLVPFGPDDMLARLSHTLAMAGGFVCLLGCLDDLWDLRPRYKLLLQIVAVLPIAVTGHAVDQVVIFGWPLELGWLGTPLTVLWLVGCINALNLLDGMDGLATVVGLCAAAMLSLIALSGGHSHVTHLAVVLAGALAGFLAYNRPPATIYLGDSGSMVIGLAVGLLAMEGSMKSSATLALTAPVVALSVPILDAALAVVRRRLSGQSIAAADRGHIHHRLLERGLSPWQALCIIGALCLAMGGAATAATILRMDALAWVAAVTLVVLLIRTRSFGHHEVALIEGLAGLALARWAGRMLAAALRQSPLRKALTAGQFDLAWADLAAQAERFGAQRLELELARGGEPPRRLTWMASDEGRGPRIAHEGNRGTGWTLARRFEHSGTICCLQASGTGEPPRGGLDLWLLAQRFKHCGTRWARYPNDMPATSISQEQADTSPRRIAA